MEDWIEEYTPNYYNREMLFKMTRKINQQFRGNLRDCKKHPVPAAVQLRTLSLAEDSGILDRLIPDQLAETTRVSGPRIGNNPLEELDDINTILTKVVKQELNDCKKLNHFIRLRDTTMRQFARAFIRVNEPKK